MEMRAWQHLMVSVARRLLVRKVTIKIYAIHRWGRKVVEQCWERKWSWLSVRRDRPIYEIPRTDDIRHISAEDYENSASLKLKRVEHFKIYFTLCSIYTRTTRRNVCTRNIWLKLHQKIARKLMMLTDSCTESTKIDEGYEKMLSELTNYTVA